MTQKQARRVPYLFQVAAVPLELGWGYHDVVKGPIGATVKSQAYSHGHTTSLIPLTPSRPARNKHTRVSLEMTSWLNWR